MNRRQFMKTAAGAAALMATQRQAYGYAVSPRITKFVTPLRHFGVEIPILTPDKTTYPGIHYYDVEAGVYRDQLHPDLPNPTRLYGYRLRGSGTYRHLGGAIVAQKDTPVRLKFTCNLPSQHILPFDPTIPSPGNGGVRQDRSAIHLHGGLVPWPSDGGPFHWTATGGLQGPALPGTGWLPDAAGALTNDYFYPNHQSARFMWYHDHAIGITRINAYAGIATGYILTDAVEAALGLPLGEILVFQDKVFWDPAIDPVYGTKVAGSSFPGDPGPVKGDLWYPYIYDPKIWKLKNGGLPLPATSCVSEMFGDTMLVNGTPYPYLNVSGMVRMRLLNACNARFLNLSFAVENAKNGEPKVSNQGVPVLAPVTVWQIGSEAGFLPAPVMLVNKGVLVAPLLMGPAERADLIVDFTGIPAGTGVLLYNDAPAPYPGGSPLFDWSTQTNNAKPGFGPNTRTIMRCAVTAPSGLSITVPTSIPRPVLPTANDPLNGGLMLGVPPGMLVNFDGASYNYVRATQEVTLNEAFDAHGRLIQKVGNINGGTLFGASYADSLGESVNYGTIQIWNIYDLTSDAHPMHFHLFNVMVLRRRPFKVNQFGGVPIWTAIGRGPDANESGWKETVKIFPGECTTVAALVENPFTSPFGSPANRSYTFNAGATSLTGTVPSSPRLKALGITGDEYVWHCHILEHEEHDMMNCLVGS